MVCYAGPRLGTESPSDRGDRGKLSTEFHIARRQLETHGHVPPGLVPGDIENSWRRSLKAGLDPLAPPTDAAVSLPELNERRARNRRISQLARPELELLFSQIAGTNFMVAFADADGVLLDTIADPDFKSTPTGRTIVPGSVWKEEHRGTNALGLALATRKPAKVIGQEHFFREHATVSCLAAPIFDSRGRIVGLIDASSDITARQHHTLALVKLAATNIENRLFLEDHKSSITLSFHPRQEYLSTMSVGLLAFDLEGNLTGSNSRAVAMLNGINLAENSRFSDIFRNSFGELIHQLVDGRTVQLEDWLGSTVFAAGNLARRGDLVRRIHQGTALSPGRAQARAEPATREAPVLEDQLLRRQIRLACNAARAGLPVLIEGESGTGKRTVAQEIHALVHPRAPFLPIDCAALSAADFDNFPTDMPGFRTIPAGHGSPADAIRQFLESGGTLHFDEISRLPAQVHFALGRFLDDLSLRHDRPTAAGCRAVVFTTSRSADALEAEGWLERDFVQRISGYRFTLPRLEERSDFAKICQSILTGISSRHVLSKQAIDQLGQRSWPGNIRDLKRALQLVVANAKHPVLRKEDLQCLQALPGDEISACPRCRGKTLHEQRCRKIRKLLHESGGNVSLVARQLGISRTTVYAHLNG